MLGLPDPAERGARRVADALAWLRDEQFLKVKAQRGEVPLVALRSPLGDGKKFKRPAGRWVTLPLGYWKNQWITALSGRGTALLLILLDLQGGRDQVQRGQWMTAEHKARYGLSDDTWTRATQELRAYRLVKVGRKPLSRDLGMRRMRNTYFVLKDRLEDVPPVYPDAEATRAGEED